MRGRLAGLVALIVLAGCLEQGPDDIAADPSPVPGLDLSEGFQKLRTSMAALPCQATSVSLTKTSDNVQNLLDDGLNDIGPAHSHAEFDLHEDLLLDSIHSDKGFLLVDISDPNEPKQLGFFVDTTPSTPGRGSGTTLDVKFSHDANNVLLAYSDAVALVDITDRTQPKLLQILPNPPLYRGQAHMLYDAKIGEGEYVFVFPSVSGEHVVVHKLTGSGPSAKLEYLTMYTVLAPMAPTRQATAPHDGYVTYDEVAKHHLLYLANSFHGVQVINVDDPAQPVTIAQIAANADGTATGYLPTFYHTVQAEWINGKRIIVTSSEVGYNTLKVFDATDFAKPKFLGQWVYDAQRPDEWQHNLQIVNGTLFEAHYEQGLFGFDLAAYIEAPTPTLTPVFHVQPTSGGSYWDVVVRKGLAYVSDTPQGLHVIGYGCFTAGQEDLTSDG